MWRRESVGSGPVGEVVVVVGPPSALRPSSDQVSQGNSGGGPWTRHPNNPYHHHVQHPPQPRRFDSAELADSPIRAETIKLVRELSKAVGSHVALATLLGGSGDGPHLRDELRRARRTAQEAAAAAKATLLPSLLDQRWGEKERTELERLWYLLLCCLDALEMSMHRCLTLLREFSLADGNNILIHTGIDCPNQLLSRNLSSSSAEPPDHVPLRDKLALEGVEASQLCKELFELRSQLQELKSSVELRSLSVHDFDEIGKPPRRTDTLISINGTDGINNSGGRENTGSVSCSIPSDDKESIESDGSQGSGITNTQRKCICYVLGFMVGMFFLAMILGVFIALFS